LLLGDLGGSKILWREWARDTISLKGWDRPQVGNLLVGESCRLAVRPVTRGSRGTKTP